MYKAGVIGCRGIGVAHATGIVGWWSGCYRTGKIG